MRKPDFERNLLRVLRNEKPERATLFELFLNDTLYKHFSGEKTMGSTWLERHITIAKAMAAAGYDYVPMHASPFHFPQNSKKHANSHSLNDNATIYDWESFEKYVSFAEKAVFNFDDEKSREIAKSYKGQSISWAFDCEEADYLIKNVETDANCQSFDLVKCGVTVCKIELTVPGRHNVADAATAAVTALSDGISPEDIKRALRSFHGAKRRFEYRGKLNGAAVYDDYAHHPSEISAVIGGAREVTPKNGRVICVFQPHTYTRTEQFFDGFVSALSKADVVVLAEIYAAREVNTTGISSKKLADEISGAIYLDSFEKISEYLKTECTSDDTVLLTGAGDIVSIGGMLPLEK